MATKRYNEKSFAANVNGKSYEFECWTTDTRNGFCHTAKTLCDSTEITSRTKQSYYNRTWERFDYETVLISAIGKCPKADRQGLRKIIIDGKSQEEHDKAEAFLASFEKMHNSLTPENKKLLAKTVGEIRSDSDARAALLFGTMLNLTQK